MTPYSRGADAERERSVEVALGKLDLDAKTRLLAGQDMWTLPALGEIGLGSMVMSDGPIGVRGRRWTADDPSVALPSPTALAASWDPALARRAGRLLAQEAHRKGVHVVLAPTVNLHRSPLGGRHFEAYSEDPYLTGAIGTGYVLGVQDGGVGVTVKHFAGNDAETERFTVDNRIGERALRELYLAPFEAIVAGARPWGVMTAYNAVNGTSMTEHGALVNGVLRGEWGFDGVVVSDWLAARSTTGAIRGGLDLAMPGPRTVYGPALAAAVRAGEVDEDLVDQAARRVLLLAARVGLLSGTPAAVAVAARPPGIDGDALAREIAARGCVLLRNEVRDGAPTLPLVLAATAAKAAGAPLDATAVVGSPAGTDTGPGASPEAGAAAGAPSGATAAADVRARAAGCSGPAPAHRIALIGAAARDARILGGGSAQVFTDHVVSPLDGLRAALPDSVLLSYAVGADPAEELSAAGTGFTLQGVVRDETGREIGAEPLPGGRLQWLGDLPAGVSYEQLHTVETRGVFVPAVSGAHRFGTRGTGGFRLTVDGQTLFEGVQFDAHADPFEAFFGRPVERGTVELAAGRPVEVSLLHIPPKDEDLPIQAIGFSLLHGEPERDPEALLDEAVAAARAAHTAVVVVATTERVESEGFDRTDLRLPGRQDELVARVAAVNPRTVVVVNAGAPVELPWRDDVAAVLLAWFPGQEAGAALADVLLGVQEPGGRLPTTWPARLVDAPVTRVTPTDGVLTYDEGLFIGYRAWDRRPGPAPAYSFGHGLGYTRWEYEALAVEPGDVEQGVLSTVRVTLRNTGERAGREVVQLYLSPEPAPESVSDRVSDPVTDPTPEGAGVARPVRWLAGFASVSAAPGAAVQAVIPVPRRAVETWDETAAAWRLAPGPYTLTAAHSLADPRLTTELTVPARPANVRRS